MPFVDQRCASEPIRKKIVQVTITQASSVWHRFIIYLNCGWENSLLEAINMLPLIKATSQKKRFKKAPICVFMIKTKNNKSKSVIRETSPGMIRVDLTGKEVLFSDRSIEIFELQDAGNKFDLQFLYTLIKPAYHGAFRRFLEDIINSVLPTPVEVEIRLPKKPANKIVRLSADRFQDNETKSCFLQISEIAEATLTPSTPDKNTNKINSLPSLHADAKSQGANSLEESEEGWRIIFESADFAHLICEVLFDDNGQPVDVLYHEANRAAVEMAGEPVTGKTNSEVKLFKDEAVLKAFGRVATTGVKEQQEIFDNSSSRIYLFKCFKVLPEKINYVVAMFQDITGQKRYEQYGDFLLKLNDELRSVAEPEKIEATATLLTMQYFNANRCYYCRIEDGYSVISRDAATEDLPSVAGTYKLSDFKLFGEVVDRGEPLIVFDANTSKILDEDLRQTCLNLKIISFIDIPIVIHQKAVGILCLVQSTPRKWSDTETRAASETAYRIHSAIERAKTEEALRRSEETKAYLLKLSDAFHPFKNALEIKKTAATVLGEFLKAEGVIYAELEEGCLLINVKAGYSKEGKNPFNDIEIAGPNGIDSFKALSAIEDVSRDQTVNSESRKIFNELGIKALLAVPLNVRGRFYAILAIYDTAPRRWTQDAIELAKETAERTVSAIERAKAEEVLTKQLDKYREINSELSNARKAALNLVEDAIQARDALHKSEEELKRLNASLEQEVIQRTAQWKESNDLLQSIFDTKLVGFSVFESIPDENGTIIDFTIKLLNKEYAKVAGTKDVTGKSFRELFDDSTAAALFETMQAVMTSGKSQQIEYAVNCNNGKKWFLSTFVKIENNLVATSLDVTERKLHEEELLKNLSILQQSEDIIEMGSWEYEIESKSFTLSKGMKKLFGLSPAQTATPDIYLLKATKESRLNADRIVKKITAEFEPFEETVQLKNNGEVKILKVKATTIVDELGKPYKIVGIDIDITEESRSTEITRIMNEMLFEVDQNWKVRFINKAATDFLEQKKEKLLHQSLWRALPQLTGSSFYRALLHAMEQKKAFKKEFFLPSIEKWIYVSVSPSPSGLIVLFTDIQSQKNAAERLKESEQRLRTVFENTPDVFARWDKESRLLYSNKALEKKTGIPYSQLIGKTFAEMGPPEEVAANYMHKLQVVIHTGLPTEHFNFFHTPSGERYYYSRMVPEYDKDGKVVSVLAIARDVTDLKKAQEELVNKNKLLVESQESLERKDNFMRIASHELKTPITSLQGYSQLLLESFGQEEDDEFFFEGLNVINKQVNKLTKLINDLLDITRVDTGSMQLDMHSFDLCEMVKESMSFMQPTSSHQLLFDGIDCQEVYGDKERINQVFLNLLTNAIKYSPKAERVEVNISTENGFVVVAVKDFGIGISATFHEKIFDRFYRVQGTSEKTFSGFGIGLFIAAEIIRRHNGRIWVESGENKGSTFYFSLPVAD